MMTIYTTQVQTTAKKREAIQVITFMCTPTHICNNRMISIHVSKVKITTKKREAMDKAAASPDDWQTLKKHQPYTYYL